MQRTPVGPIVIPRSPKRAAPGDDTMLVDDTKYKVYINNLDDELSDSESDDGKLVFLPDIEKQLRTTRIPQSVLMNSEGDLAGQNQLVLYSVPTSLTIPEEQDSVRKAIIETRARVREKQAQGQKSKSPEFPGGIKNASLKAEEAMESFVNDPDAMDID